MFEFALFEFNLNPFFFVVCLVIASVFFVNQEETKKYNDIDETNEMDYDGMGNYGRFPNKK